MAVQISVGDALEMLAAMASNSVHCVVTSPPYYGLRDYGVAGQIGLEPSPDEYVARLVAVFREVRRVLRGDGTCWVNLGDSYVSNGRYASDTSKYVGDLAKYAITDPRPAARASGIKPKDLLGIPWLLAFALRADGWYLRQDIIWAKPNPMPESVTDRCTKAHEYIFLLSKSARYYYDAAAIAEPFADERQGNPGAYKRTSSAAKGACNDRQDLGFLNNGDGWNANGGKVARNRRSVWAVASEPYSQAHFATYPPALIEPCVLAGTSERGVCAACGAPWVRVVERTAMILDRSSRTHELGRPRTSGTMLEPPSATTTGWRACCDCNAPTIPATVLDPFGGAGTTALVADRLGRDAVLIELNPEYAAMARSRIEADAPLFAEVAAPVREIPVQEMLL